ncbi:UNVERIFIED_ORG: cell division protein FtsL [Arthrobacter globiformis]|nr:cell division protein FtsL [Arthrobacter globiformis]
MSTAAARNLALPSGPSVHDIEAGLPGSARKARTPLSLVRSAPTKRRAPFVVLCFGMLAAALIAVLVLNITVSTAQYQLVKLRAEQTKLTKENQDLTQQVQNFEAPQNLAAKAAQLGMVASTGKGQVDLSTLTVSGDAKPAVKGDSAGAVIAAPAVPGQLNVVPPASSGEPLESRTPAAGETAAAQPQSPAVAKPAAPAAAAKPAALNGGTIPAPEQRTPGQ